MIRVCHWETGRIMRLEGKKISFEKQECTYLLMAFMVTQEKKHIGE